MAQHTNHGAHAHGAHDDHGAHESHGSLKSYVIGFVLSIVLTIIPLVIVLNGLMEKTAATIVLLGSAVLQFVVQLVYFMHLKEEGKPRWNLMVLILGLIIVLTIVAGSIWIMTYNKVA
ncbi:cytochrome o ubiquinol oxidase subunit IV [Cohnella sp.]|uniref:cytochrome o ubiquinol oxidase subunit IV n=1 Tax=Cohnella sp. TaxID=1883426 RepID=UPI003561FD5F